MNHGKVDLRRLESLAREASPHVAHARAFVPGRRVVVVTLWAIDGHSASSLSDSLRDLLVSHLPREYRLWVRPGGSWQDWLQTARNPELTPPEARSHLRALPPHKTGVEVAETVEREWRLLFLEDPTLAKAVAELRGPSTKE